MRTKTLPPLLWLQHLPKVKQDRYSRKVFRAPPCLTDGEKQVPETDRMCVQDHVNETGLKPTPCAALIYPGRVSGLILTWDVK